MKLLKEQEHRRQRVSPVDSVTLGMLKEYIERGGPVLRDGKRLIFGINRHRAWQIVKQCAEKAGLPKLIFIFSSCIVALYTAILFWNIAVFLIFRA